MPPLSAVFARTHGGAPGLGSASVLTGGPCVSSASATASIATFLAFPTTFSAWPGTAWPFFSSEAKVLGKPENQGFAWRARPVPSTKSSTTADTIGRQDQSWTVTSWEGDL
ncbi:unnamed protein product [Gadus morhua 'NCC']